MLTCGGWVRAGIFNNSRRSKFVARPKALAKAARKQEGGAHRFSEQDFFQDVPGAEKRAKHQADEPQLHSDPRVEEVSTDRPSVPNSVKPQRAFPLPQATSSLERLLNLAPDIQRSSDALVESAPARRTSGPSLAQQEMKVLEVAARELLPTAPTVDARPLQAPTVSADLDDEAEDGITSRKRRLQEMVGVIRPDERYPRCSPPARTRAQHQTGWILPALLDMMVHPSTGTKRSRPTPKRRLPAATRPAE